MKNKIGSIVKYTVEKNIRNRWFIVLNVLLLLVTIVTLNFGNIQQLFKKSNIVFDNDKINIIVVDNNDLLYTSVNEAFADKHDKVNVRKQEKVEYDKNTLDKNTIFLEVTPSDENILEAKIISKEGVSEQYLTPITNAIKDARYEIFSQKYSVSKDKIDILMKEPSIERVMVGVENAGNADATTIVQTALNYLVLIILMFALSKIANEISQEKMSKSIEYVLTSINEKAYLIAKVISINLTLIIQFLFAMVYAIIGAGINSIFQMNMITEQATGGLNVDMSSLGNLMNSQSLIYIVVFIIFVILTVLIQSVIQAALSSKTTNISEAGNATILLVMINLILYMVASFSITPLSTPNIFMYIVSCIPVISMYFVPTMILAGHATIIQVVIATVILIASIPFVFKLCSKIFKNGILNYTNKKDKKRKAKTQLSIEDKQKQVFAKREYGKYGFVIGFALILFISIQMLTSLLLSPTITPIYNALNAKVSIENISSIITIITYIVSLLIPTLFVLSYVNKPKVKTKFEFKKSIKYILMTLPVIAVVQLVLGVLYEKLGLNYDVAQTVYNSKSVLGTILFMLQVAILPAIFEELFVRKAILSFSKRFGVTFAIISSSVIFAIVHLNISQIVFAFILGVIFALLTIKTKSVIPAGIVHFLNNGYAVFMLIFANNKVATNIVNIVFGILILAGVFCIFRYLVQPKREKVKDLISENTEKSYLHEINKNQEIAKYRYIVTDYTFIVSAVLCVAMLVLVQMTISIL